MESWRTSVERSYNFAGKGKSSDTAAWLQAHKAELAVSKGHSTAAILIDLTKAFEMVRLELVWKAGLKLHCPPSVLRLELEAFSFARRLTYMGAVADPITTLSSILAGGAFATDALFVIMSGVCDQILLESPEASLCLFVDDLTLHVDDANDDMTVAKINSISKRCISLLEEDLGLVVSRGSAGRKTVALHSGLNKFYKTSLGTKLKRQGVTMVQQAKLLGVDYSAGKSVRRSTQRARIRKVSKRVSRFRQLGSKAALHVVKTGAGPSLRYGASAYGASSSAIKAVRFFTCGAIGKMQGRSALARATLTGYDAGALMATDPIVQWARAVWDNLAPPQDLQVTWKQAMVTVATAEKPFSRVAGPAGAMVASARRLGWQVPSWRHVKLENGTLLCLDSIALKDLQQIALRSLQFKEAQASNMAAKIGGPPDFEPLRAFLNKRGLSYKISASLRSLGEGGWWTQQKMYEANFSGVDNDLCQVCHAHVGTFYHRCCGCSGLTSLISLHPRHDKIISMARQVTHSESSLFQHGLPLLQAAPNPPPLVVRWCGGVEVDDPTFSGDVYSDGSVVGGCRPGYERGGWAAVKTNDQGKVIFGIYGTCPDWYPSSLRAELWGLLMVLRHAAPPVTIWIDNASVVDGYRKGKSWCISSSRPAADLWDLIWRKVEDLGQGDILVEKVKGHASSVDIENGTSSLLHMAGNDHADYFAKKGSALAEHLSSTSTLRQTDQLAKLWYSWLAVLISNWPKDTQGRNQTARKKKRARPAAPDNVAKAAKVDTNKFGVGHRLFRSGELVWCNICGAYAVQRFKALKLPCAGAAGKGPRAGQLARMLKGDHPLQRGVRLPLAVRLSG